MVKIQIEILLWLTDKLRSPGSGCLVLKEKIEEGTTISNLLKELAAKEQALGKVLFDPKTSQLTGFVTIILNGLFLRLPKGLDTSIKDGDTITLLPVIDGG